MGANIVIVNESADWQRSRTKARRACRLLREQGFAFDLITSESPRHAADIAATAATEGIETIVVIGGDGTVNAAVNGLCSSASDLLPRLGIIPTGSSNDLAQSLGIPLDLPGACRNVAKGNTRLIDVGCVGSHYFCSASCLGYFADIAADSHSMRGLRGSPRYIAAALSVVRRMDSGWTMQVTADGRTFSGDYAVLLVGNAPRFGGLTMLPGAKCDDGVLDCLLIEMAGKLEALHLIALVYRQAMERHEKTTRFRTRSLSVTINRPSRLCNDGELCPGLHQTVDYTVLPQKLSIITPKAQDGE
ncbi:MAG: YegS/Rv2252/BmrU family lipid kinase [Phycisphaerales bacterium]|nr:MAG: YegS/Rv2252/BmrU family lipid kinase [Phycisphaerales bacterium]